MISDNDLYEQLYSYRKGRKNSSDDLYHDYFDSKSFTSLCNMYGGEKILKYDIFIAASPDGFQAFKKNSCEVWPLLAVLFNLPPHLRFLAKNVLPLMFIPNDVQPKDLQSYLIPFVNEICSTLASGGLSAQFPNIENVRLKIHLIWFTADLAGLVKIAGITGHVGCFPCCFCLLEGFYSPLFQHYYYPARLDSDEEADSAVQFYNPSSLQLRTVEHIDSVFQQIDSARNVTERKRIATETEIKQRSVLLTLPNLVPFKCFSPDIMHLFFNVQMELLHHHVSGMQNGFALPLPEISFLDNELVAFASGISGQNATRPRPLSSYKSWKAAEHKRFTFSYSLMLLDGYLQTEYLNEISLFGRMFDICFRPFGSGAEALEVKRLPDGFVRHFESCYARHWKDRVNYCK